MKKGTVVIVNATIRWLMREQTIGLGVVPLADGEGLGKEVEAGEGEEHKGVAGGEGEPGADVKEEAAKRV